MTFTKKALRLVSFRTVVKEGKEYTFIKLADTATYENNDFMLSKDMHARDLIIGNDYDCALDVDGKYSTVTLSLAEKAV